MPARISRLLSCLLIFSFVIPACERSIELEDNPNKIILERWEIIGMGNYPDIEPVSDPSGFVEYLPDSILQEYDYETGEYYYKKYWID